MVDSEQVIMGQATMPSTHDLEHMLDSNCQIFDLPSHLNSEDMADFRPALLKFMATATPKSEVASDILKNFNKHMENMSITPVTHFAPSSGEQRIEFTVDQVPDAINPVKAKLAYIQVPNKAGDNTELHLVWKVSTCTRSRGSITNVTCSSKLKWRITGMRPLFQRPLPTRSFR